MGDEPVEVGVLRIESQGVTEYVLRSVGSGVRRRSNRGLLEGNGGIRLRCNFHEV